MPKLLRLFLGVMVILAAVILAVIFLGARLVKKSLPQTEGEAQILVLDKSVTVYRDVYGVPHIFAENEADLWRAAGYVAAQDRLWQMDFTRRAIRGTLSEIFGLATLPQDKFLRTWGFHRLSKRLAQSLSPESRAMLTAYAAGVNAFIAAHRDRLPVEFSILGYKPEPWEIEDSIGYGRLMAFRLCYSWFFEAALGKVAERYGVPMALELFPAVLENAPAIVAELPRGLGTRVDDFVNLAHTTRGLLGVPPGVMGSNSWVVGGSRTRHGKPILANDPHLGLTLPPVWYEMHLVAGELDVMGQTFPGAPGVVLGHNRALAWGFTNGMVDDLDFYLEHLNPQNPNEYWGGQAWKPVTEIEEMISVKDETPQRFDVRLTERGPLVSEILDVVRNDSLAVSIRWTGFEVSDELFAIGALNRAASWEEFLQAMRHFTVPCQNVVYADTAGNIGYRAFGRVPIRRDGKGYLPYRGWEKDGDWIGVVPFEAMPQAFNPPQNFIATANNQMHAEDYPYYLSNAWEPSSRSERIAELILSHDKIDTTVMGNMQTDIVSPHARYVLPRLLKLLSEYADSTAADTALTETEKHARRLLTQWEGEESRESVAATIFHVWALEFLKATIKDELGDTLFANYTQWGSLATRALEYFADHPDSPWFDDRATAEVENGRTIARRSLSRAIAFLQTKLGALIGDWQWGKLHQLTLSHPLGRQKPLDYIFNVGPIPLGGSGTTVNKAEYRFHDPYGAVAGPSMRMIVDLSAPELSLSIIPGGQSGQPFGPHYIDQVEMWRHGTYRQVPMSREKIAASCESVLLLVPGHE